MKFWSKGLGKRTISLRLSDGEAVKSGDKLYVKGLTGEPVIWEYIMPLETADFAEFVALLREPRIVEYLYRSPNRWRLYRTLLFGGVNLLVRLAKYGLTERGGPPPEEPTIQVPPPSDRKRRRLSGDRTKQSHRRLGASTRDRQAAKPSDATRAPSQATPEPVDAVAETVPGPAD